MKTFLGSLAVLLSVVAMAFGVYLLKYRILVTTAPPQEARPTPVVFAMPQASNIRSSTTVVGTVVAPRMLQLMTETVGTVEAIHFRSGDVVKPGQVLLELDTSVEKAMLASAKAARCGPSRRRLAVGHWHGPRRARPESSTWG
jgi:membrane fusion protein (multidrug efflux system)